MRAVAKLPRPVLLGPVALAPPLTPFGLALPVVGLVALVDQADEVAVPLVVTSTDRQPTSEVSLAVLCGQQSRTGAQMPARPKHHKELEKPQGRPLLAEQKADN